ncbi:MAG: transposase [Bacteroidales bacterium]|nr:transposase [Bacteroidales bacterium]
MSTLSSTKAFRVLSKELLADKIYCTRENRKALKQRNIKLIAKPLGRPSAVREHVSRENVIQ